MGERFIFYSVMTRWVPNQVKRILMGSNFYLLNVEDPLTRDVHKFFLNCFCPMFQSNPRPALAAEVLIP